MAHATAILDGMRRLLLLLMLGAVVAGCGGATTTGAGASAPAEDAGADADGPLYGELTTVEGERLDGAAYRNTSLALWFWAPW